MTIPVITSVCPNPRPAATDQNMDGPKIIRKITPNPNALDRCINRSALTPAPMAKIPTPSAAPAINSSVCSAKVGKDMPDRLITMPMAQACNSGFFKIMLAIGRPRDGVGPKNARIMTLIIFIKGTKTAIDRAIKATPCGPINNSAAAKAMKTFQRVVV